MQALSSRPRVARHGPRGAPPAPPVAAGTACRRTGRPRRLVVTNVLADKPTPKKAAEEDAAVTSPVEPLSSSDDDKDRCVLIPWPKRRSWGFIALDKLLATAEDIQLMARRQFLELPSTQALSRLVRGRGASGATRLTADKPVVLVLGTGWGAHAFSKVVDTDQFEVVVVSPRPQFFFTPMLPSTSVGTVEFRSLCEPIRQANPFVGYLQASCDRLDVHNKIAYCTSAVEDEAGNYATFEIPYDGVVVAVGEQSATFGVPGVEAHCYFMKEISDAVSLRKRIQQVFELASLPSTTDEARRRILHFVVVGGGPTGVEFAGTLNDFLTQDLRAKYAPLMPFVRVTLLQSAQSILTMFAARLQKNALDSLKSSGIDVRLGVRVTEVTDTQIKLKSGETLEYGVCVWSTGNATRPLTRSIIDQLPQQSAMNEGAPGSANKLYVDPYLRVIGARDAIALGDCSVMLGDRLPATAQVAAQQGAYVARMVNRGFAPGMGGMDVAPPAKADTREQRLEAETLKPLNLKAITSKPQLTELDLMAINSGDPSWAQAPPGVTYYRKPFEFLSLGLLAYIGNERALTQVDAFDLPLLRLSGQLAYLLWKSVYLTKQVSTRSRVLILFDWFKAKVFGRDLSQF